MTALMKIQSFIQAYVQAIASILEAVMHFRPKLLRWIMM